MRRIISHFILQLLTMLLLTGCFFFDNDVERWVLEPNGSTSFALSRDGRFALVYSQEHQLVLWDLAQRQQLAQLGAQDPQASTVSYIRISDNGQYAVTASQINFAVWHLGWTQAKGLWSISDGVIRDIDISNNGEQVLIGLSNGKAIYVDLVSGRRLEFLAHYEKVNSVALSPNGRYALSGGNDRMAYLWDTQTGQIIYHFEHSQRVNRVALQRDGRLAFTSDSGNQSVIWNLQTGQKQTKLHSFSRQLLFSTARFSDDGQYLITGTPSSLISVWRTDNGQQQARFEAKAQKDARPPRAVVYDVTFNSQQRVISATSAGIAQAWKFDH
ncbi:MULTISPECIES: hypothetical protein [Vibrio]|uniref:WD40 repeat domain-containing protein n=1 Tax=Vibrio TaxID=662 RepID=UPI00148373E7|nr:MULTISPECIES: hypothetical protein [Vibrio]